MLRRGRAAGQGRLHESDDGLRIGDLDDQSIVPFVPQINDHGIGGIMHVPENQLAVLIEPAGGQHAGNVRSQQANAMPGATRNVWIMAYAGDVLQWNRE